MELIQAFEEFYSDEPELLKAYNKLNTLLNSDPLPEWVQQHPTATREVMTDKGPAQIPCFYVSAARQEWLLTCIYKKWDIVVKSTELIGNSVSVVVSLIYRDPVTKDMRSTDGIGAVPVLSHVDSKSKDLRFIKTEAIKIGAPAAKTFAFKDACESLGKIFGKDLNRADEIYYSNLENPLFASEKADKNKTKANVASNNAVETLNNVIEKRNARIANKKGANNG